MLSSLQEQALLPFVSGAVAGANGMMDDVHQKLTKKHIAGLKHFYESYNHTLLFNGAGRWIFSEAEFSDKTNSLGERSEGIPNKSTRREIILSLVDLGLVECVDPGYEWDGRYRLSAAGITEARR